MAFNIEDKKLKKQTHLVFPDFNHAHKFKVQGSFLSFHVAQSWQNTIKQSYR